MVRKIFAIFTLTLLFLFSSPVYSLDTSSKTLEKYTKKISNKFTRTYCNTTKFGISYEGALAFAIGETNKEFKNNKLNKLIDYSLLKNSIVNDLEKNCQVYDFALTVTEMGIGKIELAVIGAVVLIFPILFVYASKNLDAKGVFEWMMEKPNDWIGKK